MALNINIFFFLFFQKYGGFYQTKIESHLSNTECLFQRIGFKESAAGLFQLCSIQPISFLLTLAFECFVAFNECKIIENVWKKTSQFGVRVSDVVRWRSSSVGSETDLVNLITKEYSSNVSKNHIDSSGPRNVADTRSEGLPLRGNSTDAFRTKLNKHIANVNNINMDDIPFIDETVKETEYTACSFDDHLKASLRMVGNKEKKFKQIAEPTPGSKEWSFVSEGLEQKYGKEYFEGPRKDILSDPKYVKVIAQPAPHPYVNLPHEQNVKLAEVTEYPPLSAFTRDSDYVSASGSQMIEQTLPRVPPTVRYPPARLSNSDGFASSSRPTPHVMPPASPSPYELVQSQVRTVGVNSNAGNIQKLLKQSSITNQPMADSSKKAPALGVRSQSERISSRNVPDGSFQRQMSASMGRSGSGSDTKNKWACTFCTFINNEPNNVCMICSKSREFVDTDGPPVAGLTLKVCSKCTLENDRNASVCTACGHELQKTQTVV